MKAGAGSREMGGIEGVVAVAPAMDPRAGGRKQNLTTIDSEPPTMAMTIGWRWFELSKFFY